MKKFISVLLSFVLVMSLSITAFAAQPETSDFGAYKSVVILGIDGAGAFFDDTDTPNCDRIFSENAAFTDKAKAETITISAQNWGAILLGVSYLKHGLTNEILDSVERSSEEKYPSIFRLTREAEPDAVLASFCNWNPINFGLIENDINVHKDTANDAELCDKIVTYLGENDPRLLFVQFDNVDGAGHSNGYGSEEYLQTITRIDGYIGRIYSAIEEKGAADDTLFIVVADHGGTPGINGGGGSHGGLTPAETNVFLGVRGKTVNACDMHGARNRDVAAIALFALGIEKGDNMTAKVPQGLFDGVTQTEQGFIDKLRAFINKFIEDFLKVIASLGVSC